MTPRGKNPRLGTKRIYAPSSPDDGFRVLVDRLWPRGVSKENAAISYWARDVAPSDDLRKWYRHDHDKWPEFRRRFFAELDATPEAVQALLDEIGEQPTTFVFSSREEDLNNARALVEYLEGRRR